jgi:hypothetical protein
MAVNNGDDARTVLGITLGLHHLSVDPEEITAQLKLQPSMSASRGSHYRGVRGDEQPAAHQTSKWFRSQYYTARELEDKPVSSRLEDLISALEDRADFVRELAHGGHAWIGLKFSGKMHRGLELAPELLSRVKNLGLAFSIEVFPGGLT